MTRAVACARHRVGAHIPTTLATDACRMLRVYAPRALPMRSTVLTVCACTVATCCTDSARTPDSGHSSRYREGNPRTRAQRSRGLLLGASGGRPADARRTLARRFDRVRSETERFLWGTARPVHRDGHLHSDQKSQSALGRNWDRFCAGPSSSPILAHPFTTHLGSCTTRLACSRACLSR
jgi:hypothetical protein